MAVHTKEIYTKKTINKLIKHKNVIVAESRVLHNIMNFYFQYKLIETGDHEDFYLSGFVLKKNVNSKIKNILKKM